MSLGTVFAQGFTFVSQATFLIWLRPQEFGLWATAVSATVVLSGAVNFGEVNAYLTSNVLTLRQSMRTAGKLNVILLVGGMLIASGYVLWHRYQVAILVGMLTINLPMMGRANLIYAAFIKRGRHSAVVGAQILSALARTVVGIGTAWLTGSAVAFAASMICYSACMIVVLRGKATKWDESVGFDSRSMGLRERVPWLLQGILQLLPTQIDTFVASCLAAPAVVGIYFLSYQLTAGLAALISPALYRSAVAALATHKPELRLALTGQLMCPMAAASAAAAGFALVLMKYTAAELPPKWLAAAPTICILLASLPVRFAVSLVDSFLSSGQRGWHSVRLNLVDAIGTAAAATSAVFGNVRYLAVAIVVWKAAVMMGCLILVSSSTVDRHLASATGLGLLAAVLIPIAVILGNVVVIWLVAAVIVFGAVALFAKYSLFSTALGNGGRVTV